MRASHLWRRTALALDDLRRMLRHMGRQLRRAWQARHQRRPGKPAPHVVRVMRRFAAIRRARRH
jgi:hypothetical protein